MLDKCGNVFTEIDLSLSLVEHRDGQTYWVGWSTIAIACIGNQNPT